MNENRFPSMCHHVRGKSTMGWHHLKKKFGPYGVMMTGETCYSTSHIFRLVFQFWIWVVFVSSSFFPLYSSADLYGKHIPTLQKTGPKQRFRKIRTFQCVSEWVGRLVGVVVPWHVSGPRASYGVNQTATRARCSLCSLLLKGLSWRSGPSGWGWGSGLWLLDRPRSPRLPGPHPNPSCRETSPRATRRLRLCKE